ncbi:hypothetical protein ITJ44_10155 [Clavibacter sp. VKM Ac-2873]|uniref:hypothetical protein n=1 Tax=Clavibacter sp. VKM Ac-2873 TaxID=2783813 RepID=UPI00188C7750|nr:hypothetical protein [Clavibacter sp. VKM Ac-2873]MBF4618433.1 hypothetical protein [Clavibacter sp. VKM Ac-2873]
MADSDDGSRRQRPRRADAAHRRRSRIVAAAVAGLLVASLSACSTPPSGDAPPEGGRCVPILAVEPQDPSPGDVITVTFPGVCAVVVPPEGLRISAVPVDDRSATVRATVPADAEEPLRAEIRLPDDFPTGSASVGLDDYPAPACPADASCAAPVTAFSVVPG